MPSAGRIPGRRSAVHGTGGQRVFILTPALRAHPEFLHRRVRPVVRQGAYDREPRSAIRAVGKRIPVAAVPRVGDFGKAVRAGGNVGEDKRSRLSRCRALEYLKSRESGGVKKHGLHALYRCEGRLLRAEPEYECVERTPFAFRFDEYARGRIEYPSRQSEFGRKAVDKGAESDPLYSAADRYMDAGFHGSS